MYLQHLYGINTFRYYMNSYVLAEFQYSFVVGSALFTLFGLMLAMGVSVSKTTWAKEMFNIPMTFMLVMSAFFLFTNTGHTPAVLSISVFINSVLCVSICIAFLQPTGSIFNSKKR